jgi:hypothetical protein
VASITAPGTAEEAGSSDNIEEIYATFDPKARLAKLTKLHEIMVDEAVMLWVAHDVNPRALHPRVKGFVQAQSWFQDLTPIHIEN